MNDTLHSIFRQAQFQLIGDIRHERVRTILETIDIQCVNAATLARSLSKKVTGKLLRIPAYYDPNKHTIYLNRTALAKQPQLTVHIICYHELVHACSYHRNFSDGQANIFQSGIKLERYNNASYLCQNRQLNEGIVQFLANYFNNVRDEEYAYATEAQLVRRLTQTFGITLIIEALMDGKLEPFATEFNYQFGVGTFEVFNQFLDKKDYQRAEALLTPTCVPFPAFSEQTLPLAA